MAVVVSELVEVAVADTVTVSVMMPSILDVDNAFVLIVVVSKKTTVVGS